MSDVLLSNQDRQHLDQLIDQHGPDPAALLGLLQAVQDHFRYLPPAALEQIAHRLNLPLGQLWGSATFYDQFRLQAAGQFRIKVCVGTACFIKGAFALYQAFAEHLQLSAGQDTSADGLYTLEQAACLGCCMLAPAVQIADTMYGNVDPAGIGEVLKNFQSRYLSPRLQPVDTSTLQEHRIRICQCSSCQAAGSLGVHQAFSEAIERLRLPFRLVSVSCTGLSFQAPLVEIDGPRPLRYARVQIDQVEEILARYAQSLGLRGQLRHGARALARAFLRPLADQAQPLALSHTSGMRMSTEHAGVSEPLNLAEYQAAGGLQALSRVQLLDSQTCLHFLAESRLRGRGGAGYPSAKKWQGIFEASAKVKVLVMNGDEGDPGAFMDRMLLESFPFRIIEGMAIAAQVLNISEAYLFIRSEYPLAISRISAALEQWQSAGLSPNCHFKVVRGAGAFVCGEETALLEAMEGKRGIPRNRPPYPSQKGYLGLPTLVQNVETFSLIPWIFRQGSQQFAKYGSSGSTGTKTFALAGKIKQSGLIEVPMGTTIRQVIEQYGGGMTSGSRLKAVQLGGPLGGCLPHSLIDSAIDFDSLQTQGAIMGSGGLIVMDQFDCMVDIARYFMEFSSKESCGRCTYCRIGTSVMLEHLEKLCTGTATAHTLDELAQLGTSMQTRSACGLGRNAPNPILSTLRHFSSEYQAHLAGHCPAGRCKKLITYQISEACIGCTQCAQVCPVQAISGRPRSLHRINAALCTRCGACAKICPRGAAHVH